MGDFWARGHCCDNIVRSKRQLGSAGRCRNFLNHLEHGGLGSNEGVFWYDWTQGWSLLRGVLGRHCLLIMRTNSATLFIHAGVRGLMPGNFLSISTTNSTTMCYKFRTQRSARRALLLIFTTNLATMCHQFWTQRSARRALLSMFTTNSATLCYQLGSQRIALRQRSIIVYN